MSNKEEVQRIIKENPALKEMLFTRGFLLTDASVDSLTYMGWLTESIAGINLLIDPKLPHFIYSTNNEVIILIGHVYNPFDGLYNELDIIKKYVSEFDRMEYMNQWTGVFTLIHITQDSMQVWGDCAGMQSVYYGVINGNIYISSHAQIIGDICDLSISNYVKKITGYRFWRLYGIFLPGDISPFDNVYRLVPNTYIFIDILKKECNVLRFYPTKELKMTKTEEEYDVVIDEISMLMHNNMKLIAKKWKKPAISMTGGMDSKTTLACGKGMYDAFHFYSYISMYGDKPDAEAAHKIADAININHIIYNISEDDNDFENINNVRKIMEHNYGDIGKVNPNDVRKRMFFLNASDFDVEVKSWVSEIGRANYYKKFGLKKMPRRLSPRQMTSMYKFFSYNRITAKKTDKIFKQYKKKVDCDAIYNYDASDMYLWEFRYGGWGGLTITSEHRVSYDITIPYNNRRIMELFLRLPLEKRIKDIPHEDIIRKMNPTIDSLGITIVNYNETKKRMKLERAYFIIHNLLPF